MILYRPVGKTEYELIAQSDFTAYPPRLPEQPIFYPVLNEQYAREIAEKWNQRYPDSQYTGYVTLLKLMMYTFPNFLCKLLAQAIIKNFGFQQEN